MTNERAVIGGNNPPDPIDEINAEFEAYREEAENWADGVAIETEAQMVAVDEIRKNLRQWRLALEKGQKEATAPLRKVYQDELDRWKPTIADAKRYESAIVAIVDAFKKKLAEEKKAAERAAWEAARQAEREAEAAAAKANAGSIDDMREADAIKQAAIEAEKVARAASKDQVKGMRTVTKFQVVDYSEMLRWLNKNARGDLEAFCDDYAKRNHSRIDGISGLKVWKVREAF